MKLFAGLLVALVYLALAFFAYQRSAGGWAMDHSDIGFWYGVIGTLFLIAGLGAGIGTWLHLYRHQR